MNNVDKLLDLEAKFKEGKKHFPSGRKPRANLSCLTGREHLGIWRLSPSNEDTLASWVDFNYLAASAVEVLGLKPIPHPSAIEFDPDWVREEVPSGLDAVNEVTRAWLHFLRLESLKHERIAVEDWEPFENIWDASAVQCKRSALEGKVAAALKTSLNISPLVQEWEAFKSLKKLMAGPHEQVTEAFVRQSLADQLGVPPENVTRSQIEEGFLDLIRHYGVVTLLKSDSELASEIGPSESSRDVREVEHDCATNAKALNAPFVVGSVESEVSANNYRKADPALVDGKEFVSFKTAELYLGIKERQRQELMKSGALATTGGGSNRKITTESLVLYLPPDRNRTNPH